MKCRHRKLVVNRLKTNPTKVDPTRTVLLRKRFVNELHRRLAAFKRDVIDLLVVQDAFGLMPRTPYTINVFCPTGKGGGVDATCKAGTVGKFVGKPVGKTEHVHSAKVEAEIAGILKGKVVDRVSGKQLPIDVLAKGDGVEVKSLLKGSKQAISVHPDALVRKYDWSKENTANFHTVAVDERATYEGGVHKADYSGHRMYYKRGSGRYALSQMHPVSSEAELRELISMPANKLPAKARGSLPPPPPIADLRRAAEKAHASRLAKDRARKLRLKETASA